MKVNASAKINMYLWQAFESKSSCKSYFRNGVANESSSCIKTNVI